MEKPLFIPLKREWFMAFKAGLKTIEYRRFGPRWNGGTCWVGREVILSLGYGKQNRLSGRITQFVASTTACKLRSWESIYGPGQCMVACIHIELIPQEKRHD